METGSYIDRSPGDNYGLAIIAWLRRHEGSMTRLLEFDDQGLILLDISSPAGISVSASPQPRPRRPRPQPS